MSWLLIAIISYFILAVVYIADKYLLKNGIPDPKVFAFYVGILGIVVIFLAPFIHFYFPDFKQIIFSFLAGFFSVYGLFWFYKGLKLFETSRIVTAVGGLSPLLTFVLVFLFSFGKEKLSLSDTFSFFLLVIGSILITSEENPIFEIKNKIKKDQTDILKISLITALLFSLSFIFSKYVFSTQPFWNGFIWIRIGAFISAFTFLLFFPETRKRILIDIKNRKEFQKEKREKVSSAIIFFLSQAAGGLGALLQNWAIALAPLAYISIITALQGLQYVFLFIFTIILSLKFPTILKEKISKKIIFQKAVAIIVISLGLAILVLK